MYFSPRHSARADRRSRPRGSRGPRRRGPARGRPHSGGADPGSRSSSLRGGVGNPSHRPGRAQRARRLVARHLFAAEGAFHSDAGLPSLGRDHWRYGPDNHWNGGTWPVYTLLVVSGLMQYGALERLEARRIASGLATQLRDHPDGPFPEWYDSERGWQAGPHNVGYITTAAILPMVRLAGL